MEKRPIRCLHGFLGLPSDWNFFPGFCGEELYASILPFHDWVFHFHKKEQEKRLLLGYSLGGRLALHALTAHPEHWLGAVVISAHPGLPSKKIREERYAHDLRWADRFEQEPWEALMSDWNQQTIFTSSVPRQEEDFDRKYLSAAMRTWSLGLQEDLTVAIKNLELPILWIAGAKDPKFCQLALKTKHPHSKIWIAPDASHRVPWETPNAFYQQVQQFYEEIL